MTTTETDRPHAVDVHQHLWPAELVDRLRARSRAPYLRDWTLHTGGEAPYDVDPLAHDAPARVEADVEADVEVACLSLSAPLGIEALPAAEARPLLDAWHRGLVDLPDHFRGWASVASPEPDVGSLTTLLQHERFVGVQLPATDLASPGAWQRAGAVLRAAELADSPVLVHPGPVTRGPLAGPLPGWWPPVVGYVAQLHAAWWAWQAVDGRACWPDLRVVFGAGAGLAPIHHERQVLRGGEDRPVDARVFVDSSGYGPRALDALVRCLGVDALVLGSDRPYGEPVRELFGAAATHAVRVTNPARLLGARHLDTPRRLPGSEPLMDLRELSDARPTHLVEAAGLPPGRDLDPDELVALVDAIAARPQDWAHHVAFDADERVYVSLYRDSHVDVWLLCWTPENDTGWHDHDVSSGAVAVMAGELVENNLSIAYGAQETRVPAGTTFGFGPDHIHRLNGAQHGSVSVHAYSPPLWRMGQYRIDEAGTLSRLSLSYADELRPVD